MSLAPPSTQQPSRTARWRLSRKISKPSLTDKVASVTGGLIEDLSESASKFDLAKLLSDKAATTDEQWSYVGFNGSTDSDEVEQERRPSTASSTSIPVDKRLLHALNTLTSASLAACASAQPLELQQVRQWRNAAHTAWLALESSHPQRSSSHASSCESDASSTLSTSRIKRKAVPAMTGDEVLAMHGAIPSLISSSADAGSTSVSTDTAVPAVKVCSEVLPGDALAVVESAKERRPMEWTLSAAMPVSPVTPTARHVHVEGLQSYDSMLSNVTASNTYEDALTGVSYDIKMTVDEDEEQCFTDASDESSGSQSDDCLSMPDLGYASSLASSSVTHHTELSDEDERSSTSSSQAKGVVSARPSAAATSPPSLKFVSPPLRPFRSPNRCRVRVPASMKKAIRDQRWSPMQAAHEDGEDGSSHDDIDPAHHRRKNNNTSSDLIDFLNSGPPA